MNTFETTMMTPEQLRAEFEEWLHSHGMSRGVHFYTSPQWFDEKGEDIGRGAVLHLVIEESPLCLLLNGYTEDLPEGMTTTEEQLEVFLAERGFYGELGFVWSFHVSRLD